MTDIFISYARPTESVAKLAARLLSDLGYVVWLDNQLPAHRAYGDVIEERLVEAGAVLVIWSADAVRSEWVRSEANRARTMHKLVQMTLEDIEPPMPFDMIECAKLHGWTGDSQAPGWEKVLHSIAALTGKPAAPWSLSAPPSPASPADQPIKTGASRKVDRRLLAGGIAAILATVVGVAWWAIHAGNSRSFPPIVAVVAFDNPAGEGVASSLAHGLKTEIIGLLGKIPTEVRIADVAGGSPPGGARLVVRGGVQMEALQARVDVQLLDPSDGSILWADTFTRPPQQSLQLQDEVGLAVASVVRSAAPEMAPGRQPVPAPALARYLKATRWFGSNIDSSSVSEIIPTLRETTRLAPGFAAAWARLADAYRIESRGQEEAEQNELRNQANQAVRRALSLAPDMGYAHAVLSALQPEWAWTARADQLRQAEALSPEDPAVLQKAAGFLARIGRLEDERKIGLKQMQLDLFSPMARRQAWALQMDDGNLGRAYSDLVQLQTRDPGADMLWFEFLQAALKAKDKTATAHGLTALEAAWPNIVAERHFTAASAADMLAENRRRVDDLMNDRDQAAHDRTQAVADFNRAATELRGQGCITDLIPRLAPFRPDLAFALADELYLRRGFVGSHATCGRPVSADREAATWPLFAPETAALRRDVRIWRIFNAVGLAQYWMETGLWPDFCRDPTLGYDCRTEARKALGV